MSAPILSIAGLSKAYRDYGSLTRRIGSWIGLGTKPKTEFWALNDVSFEVARGECVAILGANGAGKSTLLKLITGTSRPTQGSVSVNGHVSAVLELGLGFTPDLTGRENIQFAMGMLGHAPETIAELTPQVIAFAELGHFIDLPLRTYSSGMQARLAFSVATATRPDILIIDEVLSVGDSYFQHKSFARVREFRDQGTSILVVTHSIGDARSLCDRAIILAEGKLLQDGPVDAVADMYNALMAQKTNADMTVEQFRDAQGWSVSRSGDYRVVLDKLEVRDAATGDAQNTLRVGQTFEIVATATAQTDVPQLVIGLMIKDRQGHTVWGSNTWHTAQVETDIKAGESVTYRFHFTCNFGPGAYSITPALVSTDTHMVDNYEWIDNFVVFDVVNADKPIFIGSSYLDMSIAVERTSPN